MFRSFSALLAVAVIAGTTLASPTPTMTLEKRASGGRGTWFNTGLGACGRTNVDSDPIVALSHTIYSASDCGKKIVVTNTETGAKATGIVVDMCPGCAAGSDIDMSPGLFSKLGSLDQGVIPVTWHFI